MKKPMVVAISAEPPLFQINRILDADWARRFPGASWMPMLKRNLVPDFEVVTADVALNHVEQGYWDARDIAVIQHVHDHVSDTLVKQGALPLAITCFESPLYAGEFYDRVAEIAPRFKYRILFSGLHALYSVEAGVDMQATFPSYFLEDLKIPMMPWGQRRFMVVVIGNKYVPPACCPSIASPAEWYWWLRKRMVQLWNKSTASRGFPVRKVQLQEMRLDLIAFFMERELLDLYGKGWDGLRNLPPRWQKKLPPIFNRHPPQSCVNKLDTIRPYRYGLCIENAQFPGYVTEKIIDCLVAGVIPLYMGAPDVDHYIPSGSYIDLRKYVDWEALLADLQAMPEDRAMAMIKCGQDFLHSEQGRRYSYEGFAEFMQSIVRAECGALP